MKCQDTRCTGQAVKGTRYCEKHQKTPAEKVRDEYMRQTTPPHSIRDVLVDLLKGNKK